MHERLITRLRVISTLLLATVIISACGGGGGGGNTDNTNNPPVGVPVIIGTASNGETLTVDTTGISDADGLGLLSYQWFRDSTAITSAVNNTYTLVVADIGTQIRVRVSYTDGIGTAEKVTSAPTAPVTDSNSGPVGVPLITGTLINGETLTADTSGITDADGLGAFSYQWLRDGFPITGATAVTYTLGNDDIDTQISVAVSYTDGKGFDETVTSTQTLAILGSNTPPAGILTITGTPADNQTLTADTSGITDADGLGTFSYEWLRNGTPIPGATADTYVLSDDDVSTQISVTVSYTDDFGTNESVTSAPTTAITDVNDPPVGMPLINGVVSNEQTLTADTSGISDADGLGAFSYQWLRDGAPVLGATANTYTLSDADLGTQISVTVSYTDGCVDCSIVESVTSDPTAPVPNNVATLTDLTLSSGELDQVFQASQPDYTASVGFLSASLSVIATSTDPNADIDINGNSVPSGSSSPEIPLAEGANVITITVTATDGITAQVYTLTVTRATEASFVQQAYIKASDTAAGDQFGSSVALSGDTLVVGAFQQNSGTGAAYVYVRDINDIWTEQQILTASNAEAGDHFGRSVAIEGDTIVVGADDEDSDPTVGEGDNSFASSGAAYVFTRTGTVWTQQAMLKADNAGDGIGDDVDFFGYSVAIAGDGATIVVGAWGEDSASGGGTASNSGATYVFFLDTGVWTQQAMLKASDAQAIDSFGYSVAISGDTVVAGAHLEDTSGTNAGAAYVFTRTASVWTQQTKLSASNAEGGDNFGYSVAISSDTIVVGARWEDSSSIGTETDNNASRSGAAYVFIRNGINWPQQAYLKASNPESNDIFGYSVAIAGNTIVVGAYSEDDLAIDSGAVYVFTRTAGTWTQITSLKASTPDNGDQFGRSVAISGDTLAAGAQNEDSNATGIGGDQSDNSAVDSGAAYVWQ